MDPRRLLPALAAIACACVVVTVLVALTRPSPSGEDDGGRAARVDGQPPPVDRAGPAAVLAAWDARRAGAWERGDTAALRRLYTGASRTGLADARALRRYRDRGLRVEGVATQVLALEVERRAPARLVLLVTDRVVGGRVVGPSTAVPLPTDRASTRRVTLVRAGERWRVEEVRDQAGDQPRDQASAAASTSRTSSSSKS